MCWRETVFKTMTHSRLILAVEASSASQHRLQIPSCLPDSDSKTCSHIPPSVHFQSLSFLTSACSCLPPSSHLLHSKPTTFNLTVYALCPHLMSMIDVDDLLHEIARIWRDCVSHSLTLNYWLTWAFILQYIFHGYAESICIVASACLGFFHETSL